MGTGEVRRKRELVIQTERRNKELKKEEQRDRMRKRMDVMHSQRCIDWAFVFSRTRTHTPTTRNRAMDSSAHTDTHRHARARTRTHTHTHKERGQIDSSATRLLLSILFSGTTEKRTRHY